MLPARKQYTSRYHLFNLYDSCENCSVGPRPRAHGGGPGVFLRHHDALKLLLANGADVHATDDMGSTALHYACVNHNFEVTWTGHVKKDQ